MPNPAAMLGAELGGLEALATQLELTTTGVADVRDDASSIADTVVADLRSSFDLAIKGITGAMTKLATTVESARTQTLDTNWTGTNFVTFSEANQSFSEAMAALNNATAEAYQGFNTQMEGVATLVHEYQLELTQTLLQAEQSTLSMTGAVRAQHTSLDETMNSGLSVG